MQANWIGAGWLIGICVAQQWRELPDDWVIYGGLVVFVALLLVAQKVSSWRHFMWPVLAVLLAMGWVSWLAQARLADRLADHEDDKVTRVPVLVSDLPTSASDGVRFTGVLVGPVPAGLPRKFMVFWPGACTGDCSHPVEPGQQWRMALRFRFPSARLNFAGIDGESWMFAQGLRASATVRGTPRRLDQESGWQPAIWIEQLRSAIRKRLHRLLVNEREVNVMVALAIGDQQGVSPQDWQIFNLTGITHLVSISGSHVTLIAALGAAAVAGGWRRLRWRGRLMVERVPVRLVFVWAAGVLAFLYCLLAGWGVPAQRTFFMLAAGAMGLSGRIPLSGAQAVLAAGTAMTVLDPWAVLSTGFWLSFGAMVILILLAEQVAVSPKIVGSRWQVVKHTALLGARLQWIMTLAITPVTIFFVSAVFTNWALGQCLGDSVDYLLSHAIGAVIVGALSSAGSGQLAEPRGLGCACGALCFIGAGALDGRLSMAGHRNPSDWLVGAWPRHCRSDSGIVDAAMARSLACLAIAVALGH
ncbi:MAG: ComEC family competence protein [Burkholderiaceae bacterium]|nr:ComEC family competence protein [Burkholderiaceae bacterium]